MKAVFATRALVMAGALAFAGAASAQSLSIGVHGPDQRPPVVVEHDHPTVIEHDHPQTIVEHRSAADCASKKVTVHHENGDTTVRKSTDCD